MPTLHDLSVQYAKKQPKQVDFLTEESPILKIIPFEVASHDMWNVYEEITGVTGAGFVDLDAVLPVVKADSKLRKVDLAIMGGEIEVGEDKAQMYGGAPKYFASKLPSILRATGNSTENTLLYKNFLAYAKANKNLFDAGNTGNDNYIILAVRFVTGETTGLYSPKGFSQGTLLNTKPINGGNLYKDTNGKLVYGLRLKGYFGMQLGNKKTVAAIVNMKKGKIPTADMIDDLISAVRGNSANTFLFMHDKALTLLNTYKGAQINYTNSDKEIDRRFSKWNGVPIITSYNFNDGTDAKITVA